ncbi:MAG: polyprenyl diphosphate synthase [Candidatus Moranbacteria bacterium]|nr:polyprenyl diphosphate synthase [Candidatus Moranbacteria bacterium]
MEEIINIPNHVVVIPDGNRRWAKSKGLNPWEGHEEGAKRTEDIVREASRMGVKNLSVWGSSLNNLTKRPLMEKKALLDIYRKYFKKLIEDEDVFETQTKINVIGRWREQFPAPLKKVIEDCIEKTKEHKERTLNFFLAYNGDDEMIETVKKIVEKVNDSSKVTAELIKDNLMTRELPAVDFVIRTGGEPHWSVGFMMWDIANSEFYFSEKLYPDFGKDAFEEAIRDYSKRGRRKGR